MRRLTLGIAAVLPLVGLVLLLAAPALDIWWQHDPAHFWLVLVAGALNASLAYATGSAARRRGDARVFLVSLTFLSARASSACTRSRLRVSCSRGRTPASRLRPRWGSCSRAALPRLRADR